MIFILRVAAAMVTVVSKIGIMRYLPPVFLASLSSMYGSRYRTNNRIVIEPLPYDHAGLLPVQAERVSIVSQPAMMAFFSPSPPITWHAAFFPRRWVPSINACNTGMGQVTLYVASPLAVRV
jgi:hypothetical protein